MIKIVNEESGSVCGTKILNAETGEDIGLAVTGLTIDMEDFYSFVTAKMKVALVKTEITATKSAWITKNPMTGEFEEVSFIRFADGTSVRFADDGTPEITPAPIPVGDITSKDEHYVKGKAA